MLASFRRWGVTLKQKLPKVPPMFNFHETVPSAPTQEEQEEAARKIQASFRRYKTRKEEEQAMKEPDAGAQSNSADADVDLNDPDLSKAATKIQASFRGHKVRKELKQGERKDGESTTVEEKEEEEVDIDLNDPEVEKAATKIQATFRGYKTRKQLNHE